jgi:hypothetical protein
MAYVGIGNANTQGTQSTALTAILPSAAVTGNVLFAVVQWQNAGGTPTITGPSGWTKLGSTETSSNSTVTFWYLTAAYNSGSPPALGWSSTVSDYAAISIVALSGRTVGAQTFAVHTPFAGQVSQPTTMIMTGGTSAANDDLLLLFGVDNTGTIQVTYTNASGPGAFTNEVAAADQYAQVGVQYLNAYSGGATGSATFVGDDGFGGQTLDFAGCFLSIPSAAASNAVIAWLV